MPEHKCLEQVESEDPDACGAKKDSDLHVNSPDVDDIYCQQNDPIQEEIGISWYKASFLTMNAALGAGLLNFPSAFKQAGGIASGNIIHVIFVSFAFGSLAILAKCAAMKRCRTYQEVVLKFCGIKWSLLSSLFISIYCFITCITFIIIIGDQFDRVFASYVGHTFCHHWYMNRTFTMTITSILLIGPCCFKRMDGFQFMSYAGVASIVYLMSVVAAEMQSGTYPKGEVEIWNIHPIQMFLAVPTVSFGYQCHVSSIPIYSCLKKKDERTFIMACAAAILMCISVYTVAANCGYLTFGSFVTPDVLVSYDARKPHVLVAILLLAVKSWTTYPILLFCVREAVNDFYLYFAVNPSQEPTSESFRRKVLAISLCIGTIIFAVFIPSIDIAVKLLGSLAAVFIFVFPGLCLLLETVDRPGGLKTYSLLFVSLLYLSLGVFIFGLSFTLGLQDAIHPEDDVQPICY